MVGRPASRGDEFVSDSPREGEIGQPVPMEVADLTVRQAEFHTAEPMGVRGHPRPCRDFPPDPFSNITHAMLPFTHHHGDVLEDAAAQDPYRQ